MRIFTDICCCVVILSLTISQWHLLIPHSVLFSSSSSSFSSLPLFSWSFNAVSFSSSHTVTPPTLTVPAGGATVSVKEGGTVELVCLVDGKPRPPVLWSRGNKDLTMPNGEWVMETPNGRLRLTNVSRDLMGPYRCQTAPYNGLNIKRREAQVQLNVQCKYCFRHMKNMETEQNTYVHVHISIVCTMMGVVRIDIQYLEGVFLNRLRKYNSDAVFNSNSNYCR